MNYVDERRDSLAVNCHGSYDKDESSHKTDSNDDHGLSGMMMFQYDHIVAFPFHVRLADFSVLELFALLSVV